MGTVLIILGLALFLIDYYDRAPWLEEKIGSFRAKMESLKNDFGPRRHPVLYALSLTPAVLLMVAEAFVVAIVVMALRTPPVSVPSLPSSPDELSSAMLKSGLVVTDALLGITAILILVALVRLTWMAARAMVRGPVKAAYAIVWSAWATMHLMAKSRKGTLGSVGVILQVFGVARVLL